MSRLSSNGLLILESLHGSLRCCEIDYRTFCSRAFGHRSRLSRFHNRNPWNQWISVAKNPSTRIHIISIKSSGYQLNDFVLGLFKRYFDKRLLNHKHPLHGRIVFNKNRPSSRLNANFKARLENTRTPPFILSINLNFLISLVFILL